MVGDSRRRIPEQIAEATVAITFRMDRPVLLPQHHQIGRQAASAHRPAGPIRLSSPAEAAPDAGNGKQTLFKNGVGQITRQRPRPARQSRHAEIVPGRAARHPERRARSPGRSPHHGASRASVVSCRMVSSLLAGIPSLSFINEGLDAEGLTQRKRDFQNPAGFNRNARPVSFRNRGRFKSERWPLQVGMPPE